MAANEKMQLPIVNDKCPVCGNTEGLARKILDELREEGKIDKKSFLNGPVIAIPLLDPLHPPKMLLAASIKLPVLLIFIEVCDNPECMTVYCTKFDLQFQDMPVQFQTIKPGGSLPAGFGKG